MKKVYQYIFMIAVQGMNDDCRLPGLNYLKCADIVNFVKVSERILLNAG